MTMHNHEMRKFISILMESPLYMTLSLTERQSLLEKLTQSYPRLDDEDDAGKEDGVG